MGQRDIITKYIKILEKLYKEHRVLERVGELARRIEHAETEEEKLKSFSKVDELDDEMV